MPFYKYIIVMFIMLLVCIIMHFECFHYIQSYEKK